MELDILLKKFKTSIMWKIQLNTNYYAMRVKMENSGQRRISIPRKIFLGGRVGLSPQAL